MCILIYAQRDAYNHFINKCLPTHGDKLRITVEVSGLDEEKKKLGDILEQLRGDG